MSFGSLRLQHVPETGILRWGQGARKGMGSMFVGTAALHILDDRIWQGQEGAGRGSDRESAAACRVGRQVRAVLYEWRADLSQGTLR